MIIILVLITHNKKVDHAEHDGTTGNGNANDNDNTQMYAITNTSTKILRY